MTKKILYYFSPCVLVSLFLIMIMINALIDKDDSEGWSMMVVVISLPYLIGLVISDAIVRFFCKKDLKKIWLIEIGIILVASLLLICYIR